MNNERFAKSVESCLCAPEHIYKWEKRSGSGFELFLYLEDKWSSDFGSTIPTAIAIIDWPKTMSGKRLIQEARKATRNYVKARIWNPIQLNLVIYGPESTWTERASEVSADSWFGWQTLLGVMVRVIYFVDPVTSDTHLICVTRPLPLTIESSLKTIASKGISYSERSDQELQKKYDEGISADSAHQNNNPSDDLPSEPQRTVFRALPPVRYKLKVIVIRTLGWLHIILGLAVIPTSIYGYYIEIIPHYSYDLGYLGVVAIGALWARLLLNDGFKMIKWHFNESNREDEVVHRKRETMHTKGTTKEKIMEIKPIIIPIVVMAILLLLLALLYALSPLSLFPIGLSVTFYVILKVYEVTEVRKLRRIDPRDETEELLWFPFLIGVIIVPLTIFGVLVVLKYTYRPLSLGWLGMFSAGCVTAYVAAGLFSAALALPQSFEEKIQSNVMRIIIVYMPLLIPLISIGLLYYYFS